MIEQHYVWDIEQLDAGDTRRFGGKATGLARMINAGIPVPPAFVIGTDAFHAYQQAQCEMPPALELQLREAMTQLGDKLGKAFASEHAPLLVSVRSGAQVSMPGMMDTVLNLGLSARSALHLIQAQGRAAFVIDSWMRYWRMYADIVLKLDGEALIEQLADERALAERSPTLANLLALEAAIQEAFKEEGEAISLDPFDQLSRAVLAVFDSWNSPRAKAYRQHQGIAHDLGTAVTVQAMVFGNVDDNSGSGVAFSRNPNTGESRLYGEYLIGRQGEDLVSGASTPVDLALVQGSQYAALYADLTAHGKVLERLYEDAVDIEFTVEAGRLFLLQVRAAKRTAVAAVRIATDLVREGVLTPAQALTRVTTEQLKKLLRPSFDSQSLKAARLLAKGIGSSPGQAAGIAVLDADRAAEMGSQGHRVILVRPTTSPMDIRGMLAAEGIVTARGGALSHAAVVSRAQDKPCVVGCESIAIDLQARTFTVEGEVYAEGQFLSIDGTEGQVYLGDLPLKSDLRKLPALAQLLSWAEQSSRTLLSYPLQDPREAALAPDDAHGLGVVAMTDVAQALNLIDGLVASVAPHDGQDQAQREQVLQAIAEEIGSRLCLEQSQKPICLRLPRLGSERARLLVPDWELIEPRMHLPLGHPGFYRPILAGLDRACKHAGRSVDFTVLLSGVTEPDEWCRFARELEAFTALRGGVSIQNAAGLAVAPEMLEQGACVWLDMDEIIRSSHGFHSERYFSSASFDDLVQQGVLGSNPRTALKPFLQELLLRLGQRVTPNTATVGVDCSLVNELAVVQSLYRFGYRQFSIPARHWQTVRLGLGHAAATG